MVTQDAPADVGPGVEVLGRLDDEALAEAYRRAWVFCLPSDYEGFGIPYAEALASGTPVVATPNVGARYVLDDGRAGVIVDLPELGRALVDCGGGRSVAASRRQRAPGADAGGRVGPGSRVRPAVRRGPVRGDLPGRGSPELVLTAAAFVERRSRVVDYPARRPSSADVMSV